MKFSNWLEESVKMVKEVYPKQPIASKEDKLEEAEVAYQTHMEAFFEGVDRIREVSQGDDIPDAEELYVAYLGMIKSMNALKAAARTAKMIENLNNDVL